MQDGCSWGKFSVVSHWWPYMTQHHWSSLPSPCPLVVFTYVIVFTLLYVGTIYLQAILLSKLQMESEIQVPPWVWPQAIWGIFIVPSPKFAGVGGRIKDLPWWLISLPSLSCFSHWVKGYILFLSRWWESPIFFLAYCIDFVKLWLSCPDLTLDIGRVLNILFRVSSPQKPSQQPTNQT